MTKEHGIPYVPQLQEKTERERSEFICILTDVKPVKHTPLLHWKEVGVLALSLVR